MSSLDGDSGEGWERRECRRVIALDVGKGRREVGSV